MQTSTPSYDLTAESALLGAYYLQPDLLYRVEMQVSDFYAEQHRLIYTAMLTVYMDGVQPDLVSLPRANEDIDTLTLMRILNEAVTASNASYHARIVKEMAKRRRYREAIIKLQGKTDDDDFLQQTEKTLLELQDDTGKTSVTVKQALKDVLDQMAINATREYVGIQTGFYKLNECCVGLCRKHLWILGAYTSHGKSTLLSQIVSDICDNGAKALVLSVEDSIQDKILRLVATRSGVPISKLVRGKCLSDQFDGESISDAFGDIKGFDLHIYDDAYTLDEMELRIKKHKLTGGLDVVAIDFVQNILTGGESIYDRMSEVAIRLQRMAKKHDVCIVALSQISEGKEKGSINLRGAQELASAADIVLWIEREPDKRDFRLVIRKNRPFGRTGKINMEFTESWTGMREVRNDR